jgi:hypothetical protein
VKIYRLYIAKPILFFYPCFFATLILAVVTVLIAAGLGLFGPDGPPFWFLVAPLGIIVVVAYTWLRVPFEIRVENGVAEFRSLFRRTVVRLAEIKSVRAKTYALGFVDVIHANGTVHLLNQIDGFHDLILTIKSANPTAEIKGC